jgi:hypothetical protein
MASGVSQVLRNAKDFQKIVLAGHQATLANCRRATARTFRCGVWLDGLIQRGGTTLIALPTPSESQCPCDSNGYPTPGETADYRLVGMNSYHEPDAIDSGCEFAHVKPVRPDPPGSTQRTGCSAWASHTLTMTVTGPSSFIYHWTP